MTDYYIDGRDGSNSNSGTSTTDAYADFTPLEFDGATPIDAGDTVYVRGADAKAEVSDNGADFYKRQGTEANPIVVRPYQDENPVIDFSSGSGNGFQGSSMQYWTFRGLELKNTTESAIKFRASSSGPACVYNVVENCDIHDFGSDGSGDGINIGGNDGYNVLYHIIRNNYVHGSASDGSGTDGISVFGPNAGYVTIENNVVERCADDCIDLYDSDATRPCLVRNNVVNEGGVISDGTAASTGNSNGFKLASTNSNSGGHYVINCVASNCGDTGFEFNAGDTRVTVVNCTSYNNGTGFRLIDDGSGSTHYVRNCIADGNGAATSDDSGADTAYNTWDLSVSPSFRSTAYGSDEYLRLSSGDACREAGTRDVINETHVLPRWSGSRPDLGAYQYHDGTARATSTARIEQFSEFEATGTLTLQAPDGTTYSVDVESDGTLSTSGPL
jgi:hypothetical protein